MSNIQAIYAERRRLQKERPEGLVVYMTAGGRREEVSEAAARIRHALVLVKPDGSWVPLAAAETGAKLLQIAEEL